MLKKTKKTATVEFNQAGEERVCFAVSGVRAIDVSDSPDDEDDLEEKRECLQQIAGAGKDAVICSLKDKITVLEATEAVKDALYDKLIDKLMTAAIGERNY